MPRTFNAPFTQPRHTLRIAATNAFVTAWALATGLAFAAPPAKPVSSAKASLAPKPEVFLPSIEAREEAERTLKQVALPKGVKATVWAAEPMLKNPVAFAFDEKGRMFVAEAYRTHSAVLDNRLRERWASAAYRKGLTPQQVAGLSDELLNAELAARSVADRERLMQTYFVGDMERFTKHTDLVRRVVDADGDGVADQSTVYAAGFDKPLEGLLAGVLARRGEVWATNIPSLWKLSDKNDDGAADVREEVSTGYGVRFAFFGHDLHGLRIGQDGRLYYSLADRGAEVRTREGKLIALPDRGGVFRSELDGSRLELYAEGLRNPQELAFDEHGNLFTGDNNSDGGDKARFIYVVEGGDSGWRVGYQAITEPNLRGPWNREKLWHPQWKGQAAHLVPPIENIANGPSGLAYHPGAGHLKDLEKHFFLVDFRGQASSSGIHTFTTAEQGAGFKLVSPRKSIWGVLATDIDFGPDGALYVADWIAGWSGQGKGRIYRLSDADPAPSSPGETLPALIASDHSKRDALALVALLAHADVRVRMEAQFALANMGRDDLLLAATQPQQPALAQLHGVWGLGQILRQAPGAKPRKGVTLASIEEALSARLIRSATSPADSETRAQVAKVLGECPSPGPVAPLVAALKDPHARVRFFAAQSLARLGTKDVKEPILSMLAHNADRDPFLRHAGVMALAATTTATELAALAAHPNASVRLASTVALRRLRSEKVSAFLNDKNILVAREAARAINDEPIEQANASLAALGTWPQLPKDDALLIRVVEANFREGSASAANTLARIASDTTADALVRNEAILALSSFVSAQPRSLVTGAYRALPPGARDGEGARRALTAALEKLLVRQQPNVFETAARAAAQLHLQSAAGHLARAVQQSWGNEKLRIAALTALSDLGASELPKALVDASRDPAPSVRLWAFKARLNANPEAATDLAVQTLRKGSLQEKQAAIQALGTLKDPAAKTMISQLLEDLLAGRLNKALTLDVQEAATRTQDATLLAQLAAFEKKRPDTEIAPYLEAIEGGDPEQGKAIFASNTSVQCRRCHSVEGHGGEVGPELKGIGQRRSRQYLLEAVVFPSKHFAAGYESVLVTMKDGAIHGGTVKQDTPKALKLASVEEGELTLIKKAIASREPGASGMPDGFGSILTKRQLRDLVAFLAAQK